MGSRLLGSSQGNLALLTACVQCHVKPFNSGDFRRQLQDAFLEMRKTVAVDHPVLAQVEFIAFDLDIRESPELTLDVLWDRALDAGFLKSHAPTAMHQELRQPPTMQRGVRPVVGACESPYRVDLTV